MRIDKLKLNDDKAEVVLYGTTQQTEKLDNSTDKFITKEVIKPVQSTRSLDFFMELGLKWKTQTK